MLAALVIVFRETMEAGLVIGIVLAATKGIAGRGFWVGAGIAGGVCGASLVAAFTRELSHALAGLGQQIFSAAVLALAVVMRVGHNVWMSRHGREMAAKMKAVGADVVAGRCSFLALAVVVGVSVLREGSEVVLFLYGISLAGGNSAPSMLTGGAGGLALGAGMAALLYLGLLSIPTRHLFKVTSLLLALLAAGMAAQAAAFLQQAQVVNVLTRDIWNTSAFLSQGSIPGQALHTLIGYTDRPDGLQLIAYTATLSVIYVLMRLFGNPVPTPKTI
ncbi:MAG: FTR1 family protein [Alphaproteobacteria bacterium]|nr:FTR1 family protein [Alphaproteobacteria bacterium]